MPPKGSGQWPATEAECRDRDRAVELVHRVGARLLVFHVYDLHAEIRREPRLRLEVPRYLHRHLRALTGTTIIRVGTRNSAGGPAAAPRGSNTVYVLKDRHEEYRAAPTARMDSLEQVYVALWVAVTALKRDEVPTVAVTRVLQSFEELALEQPRQTALLLKMFADRAEPLAVCRRVPGERWVRWAPVGAPPMHPKFDEWVRSFAALQTTTNAVVGSGHATLGEMVRELVETAISLTCSTTWPVGRPVTIKEIEAAAGRDSRAQELAARLRRAGGSLSDVLGNITKTFIASRAARVQPRIVRIPGPPKVGTYYDVPSFGDFAARSVVPLFEALKRQTALPSLEKFAREHAAAQGLLRSSTTPEIQATAAVRLLAVQHALDQIQDLLDLLEPHAASLSKAVREAIEERAASLARFREGRGTHAEALERARACTQPLGVDVSEILAAARPLLTAGQYASFFPQHQLRGLTPPQFMARAVILERYPNPAHTWRSDTDPDRAAITCVDRVEALVYAAERTCSPMLVFLRSGARLLGSSFRHPQLFERLLQSARRDERIAALAALLLLGSESAETGALDVLGRAGATEEEVIAALRTLLALRRFVPERLPAHVRTTRSLPVMRALREVALACTQDRWLLQPTYTTHYEKLKPAKRAARSKDE